MKKILFKIKLFLVSVMIRISIALRELEVELIHANPFNLFGDKEWVLRNKSELLKKMDQGQRDEQYVKDFYEILKKADNFLRTSTPEKIAMAVDKYGMNIGQKDKYGRRFDHYGFYDPKHKHYGKTLKEVMEMEVKERTVQDEDYPVQFIFSNKPIVEGIAKLNDIVEIDENKFEGLNDYEKAKIRKFPMKIIRDNENVVNKIECITEYLHIKKIDSSFRIFEFFIPRKYKLYEIEETDKIFKELINFKQIWIKDEYGGDYGFSVNKYYNRIKEHNEEYEILKFEGIQMENLNNN